MNCDRPRLTRICSVPVYPISSKFASCECAGLPSVIMDVSRISDYTSLEAAYRLESCDYDGNSAEPSSLAF